MLKETQGVYGEFQKLDLFQLPEIARRELLDFYEFLLSKYQKKSRTVSEEKQRILLELFQEAEGKLPSEYTLNREELHER